MIELVKGDRVRMISRSERVHIVKTSLRGKKRAQIRLYCGRVKYETELVMVPWTVEGMCQTCEAIRDEEQGKVRAKMEKSKMGKQNDTPIYDQAFVAEMDRIIETGGDDDQLDALQRMDDETRPKKLTERSSRMLGMIA